MQIIRGWRQRGPFWALLFKNALKISNMKFRHANTYRIQCMWQGISLKSERINPWFKPRLTFYCTNNQLCVQKMLTHGLNHGLILSLFKLLPCHIHWILYVLACLNFIFELFKAVLNSNAQNGPLCLQPRISCNLFRSLEQFFSK